MTTKVRCSAAISSITLVTTGVVTPTAVTDGTALGGSATFNCTAAEATGLCSGPGGSAVLPSDTVNLNTGTIDVKIRAHITTDLTSDIPIVTAITVNGHAYTLSGITVPAMLPADAKALLDYKFCLVSS